MISTIKGRGYGGYSYEYVKNSGKNICHENLCNWAHLNAIGEINTKGHVDVVWKLCFEIVTFVFFESII